MKAYKILAAVLILVGGVNVACTNLDETVYSDIEKGDFFDKESS